MTNRKRISYILFCIVFILILFFSNKIIVLFLKHNFVKATEDIGNYKKDDVHFFIDSFNSHTDIFDSFNLIGWVFCETPLSNDNKEIWVILENDKGTYKTKIDLIPRRDLLGAFENDYDIKGMNHGFSGFLSTVGVKKGIYKLYLYCKENNESYGIVDTGIMLKKDSRGISQYTWESTLANISSPVEDIQAESSLDSANITAEGYLQIVGWSFVDGFDAADQSVYIRLSNDDGTTATYSTKSVLRPDVCTAYKNDLYNNSGFKAVIPEAEVPDGDIKIEVLVENGGNIYLASKIYSYSSDTSNEEDPSEVAESETTGKNISAEVEINSDNIVADSRLKYHIDSCVADSLLSVKGWAYIGDKNASDTSVYLAVTKPNGSYRVFNTKKVSRPDVAKHFNNELYSESGFKAEIPLDAIDSGDNIITVIAEHDEMLKAEKTYIFNYTVGDSKK